MKTNNKINNNVNIVAIVIGLLGVGFGLYQIIFGELFETYFMSLFLGVTLAGIIYSNNINTTNEAK